MLSLEESNLFFRMLCFYSSAFIFPFQVDRRRGKLKTFSGSKFHLWLCLYIISLIIYVQGLARFLWLLILKREVILLHLPVQFDVMIAPLVHHPVIITIFCLNSDLFVKVFNEMYPHQSSHDDVSKPRRRFMQLLVQEQLISGIGFMTCGAAVFYGLMVVCLQDMSHLLINIEQIQFLKSSKIVILLTTLLETWSVAMWVLTVGFFLSLNCLVPSKVYSTLNKLSQDLRYVRHKDSNSAGKLNFHAVFLVKLLQKKGPRFYA